MPAATLSQPHERLRDARRLAGLSQATTAAAVGLTRETVNRLEAGDRRYITARTLILLGQYLNVHISATELQEVAAR